MNVAPHLLSRAILSPGILATLLVAPSCLEAESAHGAGTPVVEFDVPRTVACRDVTTPEFAELHPHEMLVEAYLPVSVVLYRGDVRRIEEVVIEVDGSGQNLRVGSFAPATRLESDITKEIEVKSTSEKARSIDATLGGKLPVPGADAVAYLTPSISAGATNRHVSTETVNRLPPKQAIVVSGTTNRSQAVYFKLRPSTQTTLEGQHELSVQFVVPRTWAHATLQVTCVARGQKKWLWMEQTETWNNSVATVELYRSGDLEAQALVAAKLQSSSDPCPFQIPPTAVANRVKVAKPVVAEEPGQLHAEKQEEARGAE